MSNKHIYILFLAFLSVSTFFGQDINFLGGQEETPKYDPVQWSGSIEKLSDDEYVIHYDATVEKDWHIYSIGTEYGLPFRINYENQKGNFEKLGAAEESETETKYDSIFEGDASIYIGYEPKISQRVKLTNKNTTVIKSGISYQVCKEVCIPQDFYVVHDLTKQEVLVFKDDQAIDFETYGGDAILLNPNDADDGSSKQSKNLWTVFLLSFIAGLLALLTPCIFPMIPLTVSYFTKQSTSRAKGIRNAVIYGVSIILIYVVLGLAVTAIFGETALVELSTSVVFNILIFILLVVFAISFFGVFEITLPQSWANKMDQRADKGGIIGIFFMAMALAIVSFSCTGPIVGTALVQSATEGGIAPIVSMLGFSSAIALPFTLFALFPSWLNSLPKSGGWLNTVKVVLGFLELALAFKFLSNADLVVQAHLLERELFLGIIIVVMIGLALYLFGLIRFAHDSKVKKLSIGRVLFASVVAAFVVYMVPGLWGAPLKMISGFPPPLQYSISHGKAHNQNSADDPNLPKGAEYGPHNLISFTDYETGLAFAKAENKPVLIDFTGYACINCRRMEERVWSDPAVLKLLQDEIVLISLYGDSREELPKEEQHISASGRRIRTVGNKWSDFQIIRYDIIAAPYYVLMDHEEKNLNDPVDYTPNIQVYEAWLQDGINHFKSK